MTREDVGVIYSLVSIALCIGLFVDSRWFYQERFIKHLVKKAKKQGRCLICNRPMNIVSDDENN